MVIRGQCRDAKFCVSTNPRNRYRFTIFCWYSRPSVSFTRNTYTPAGRDFTSRVAVPSCRDVARNVSTNLVNRYSFINFLVTVLFPSE